MNQQTAITLIGQALLTAVWISLPLIAVLFVVGVVVSLLQTLTSIQDASVGSIPRLAAALLTLLIAMPWMLTKLVAYTERLIASLPTYAH